MNGMLAIIFGVFGGAELVDQHCPTACFARNDAPARVTLSAGRSQFNRDWLGSEIMVAYDFARSYGPLQPMVSASYSEQGESWLGGGAKWRLSDPNSPFFIESAFQIGFHDIADGPNIGGTFHFRSDVGVGYEFDNGAALILTYDHRSNGGLKQPNPGLETLIIEYSIPLE